MKQNPFLLFLIEIIERIGSKSPTFFVILQWISSAVVAVAGIPAVLVAIFSALHYTPPALFTDLENKFVAICGLIALFFSMLPVQNQTKAVSADGQPLKATDNKKLPCTAQAEDKDLKLSSINHPKLSLSTKK